VPKEQTQNVATPDTHRAYNTENKETEITDQKENQKTWDEALKQVAQDLPVGETADRLAGTALIEVTDTRAVISVPNRNALAWFERRLYGQIAKALKTVIGKDVDLQFTSEMGFSPAGSLGV